MSSTEIATRCTPISLGRSSSSRSSSGGCTRTDQGSPPLGEIRAISSVDAATRAGAGWCASKLRTARWRPRSIRQTARRAHHVPSRHFRCRRVRPRRGCREPRVCPTPCSHLGAHATKPCHGSNHKSQIHPAMTPVIGMLGSKSLLDGSNRQVTGLEPARTILVGARCKDPYASSSRDRQVLDIDG